MKTINYYTKISIALLLISVTVSTSQAQRKLEKARELKENYQYSNALAMYNDQFKERTPKKATDIRDIAHCYLMMNDVESAQQWLSRINSMTVYSPGEMLNYANALKASGDYREAIIQFGRFGDMFPERAKKVPEWIQSCKEAENWIAHPLSFEVTGVEGINTKNSDFGLIPFRNDYIFSSDRVLDNKSYGSEDIFGWTGNPYLKIFSISGVEEDITSNIPAPIEGVNSTFHNGPGVFDPTSERMYYTITKMQKTAPYYANSDPTSWVETPVPDSYINRLEIYSAKLVNNKWEDIKPFKYNKSDKYSVGHPCVSADGKTLYFASNMPGGFGNSDIYYCTRQTDGEWSTPVNAGATINTDGKEVFPVLDQNGTFYFSSDGHPGMGGLDIFETHGTKKEWSKPENLKYPVNSSRDDFLPYFTLPGVRGYLSSNRDGGVGEDDIYFFSKQITLIVTTRTRDNDNKVIPLEDVNLKFEDLIRDKSKDETTDKNGMFVKKSNCGSVYEITGTKPGYFQQAKSIQSECSKGNDTMYVDLLLEKLEENKSYVLENIYYDFDKWNIRPDAAKELDKLVAILNEYPNIDIELGSHTDTRGTLVYNDVLSQKRAESAVEYIISKGIVKHRITAKGYGKRKLVNNCTDGVFCSDADHQMNRRTEFTVTKIHKN